MVEKTIGWLKSGVQASVALIALAVNVQIIFGNDAAFLPGDVVGNITSIVASLGAQGLVGLASAAVLYHVFTTNVNPANKK